MSNYKTIDGAIYDNGTIRPLEGADREKLNLKAVKAVWDDMSLAEHMQARAIFEELKIIEKEEMFRRTLLYKLGMIEGIRKERARRRGGVSHG